MTFADYVESKCCGVVMVDGLMCLKHPGHFGQCYSAPHLQRALRLEDQDKQPERAECGDRDHHEYRRDTNDHANGSERKFPSARKKSHCTTLLQCPNYGKAGMHCAMPSSCYLDSCPLKRASRDDARVQLRSQRDTGRRPNGAAPHHQSILAIVGVIATRDFGVPSRVSRVEPNSPHAEAFWQDAGRTEEGQQRTPEAPTASVRVQPACPTPERRSFYRCSFLDPQHDPWNDRRNCLDFRACRETHVCARARAIRIENLGPLPAPLPEDA